MSYPIIKNLRKYFVGYCTFPDGGDDIQQSALQKEQTRMRTYIDRIVEPATLYSFASQRGCVLSIGEGQTSNAPPNGFSRQGHSDEVFYFLQGSIVDELGRPIPILDVLQKAMYGFSTDPSATFKQILSTAYGDYAIVVYIPSTNSFFMAVSPGGACWLYYRQDSSFIRFASHPLLLVDDHQEIQLDYQFFTDYLEMLPVRARTPYRGISRLRPGFAIFLHAGKRANITRCKEFRWWRIPSHDKWGLKTSQDYVAGLRSTLKETVLRHIGNHQNVYVSLSAGIDSGAIAVSAKSLVGRQRNFTLGSVSYCTHGVQRSDEYPYAAEIAKRLQIDNVSVAANTDYWRLDSLLRFAEGMAFPTEHLMLAPMQYQLSQAAVAQQPNAILLTGAGGEVFLGDFTYLCALLKKRCLVQFASDSTYWLFKGYGVKRIARDIVSGWQSYNEKKLSAQSAFTKRNTGDAVAENKEEHELLTHPMLHEMESFLTNELLGAETLDPTVFWPLGVTTSSPFLDRKVLEFALSISLNERIDLSRDQLGKPLLRTTFPEIPREISLKAAQLFIEEYIAYAWIKNARHNRLDEILSSCTPYFDMVMDVSALSKKLARLRNPSEIKEVAGAVSCLIWLQAQLNTGLKFATH